MKIANTACETATQWSSLPLLFVSEVVEGGCKHWANLAGDHADHYKAKLYGQRAGYARAEDGTQTVHELKMIRMTRKTHRASPLMQVQQSDSCECDQTNNSPISTSNIYSKKKH